jgi:hypothetical protein
LMWPEFSSVTLSVRCYHLPESGCVRSNYEKTQIVDEQLQGRPVDVLKPDWKRH